LRRKTHEEYVQDLKDKRIKVFPLESYKGSDIKIKHKCQCGNTWDVKPNHVLRGVLCWDCKKKFYTNSFKKTHEDYVQELKDKGIKVVPLEKYKNSSTKIKHKCECGNIWSVKPVSVLAGIKCGKKSNREYLQELKQKRVNIEPLEPYAGMKTKILHKCICGMPYKIDPEHVLRHQYCGCLNLSNGEKAIQNYLLENNIDFESQVSFSDLIGEKYKLRYDFGLYNKEKLICLIEYHGEQHFRFSNHLHRTKERFIASQKRDQKKKEYAISKDIPLIEIKHNREIIPTLEAELQKLGIGQNVEQLVLF